MSGRGAYREAVREQKISADVSATSITTRCLAGEKSPPLSLQGHQAQTGCVRGHPGEEVPGPGPPSGSHSCGLVVQNPLWREVPQRVSEQTPDLSFTRATWSCTVGGEWQRRRIYSSSGYFSFFVCMLLSRHVTMVSDHFTWLFHSLNLIYYLDDEIVLSVIKKSSQYNIQNIVVDINMIIKFN